jgi:tetratricopeptide (TPR) repeat protein
LTDLSSASIPKPKNWQDFERNSRVLFECILNDIHVENNGRIGQPQHGVDIFGRLEGNGGRWVGVQCKGKDEGYGGKVTETELRNEVEKTRKFEPPISDFFLITTAPDDAAIQAVARKITQEREQEGNPLSVSVLGWGQIEERITRYPKALEAFHPDASPYSSQLIEDTTYLRGRRDEDAETLKLILNKVNNFQQVTFSDGTSAATEAYDKNLHKEIDGYRDLILDEKPITALKFLEALKIRVWESASDRIKFRIITNIASSKLRIGKENEQEVVELFLEAATYQPDDKIAMANQALAYLLKGDQSKVIETAKAALIKNPNNAEAACYLVQSSIKDDNVEDPLENVPLEIRQSAPVDLACINFYQMRNDSRWTAFAKDAGKRHPDNEQLKRFAAEAELETALNTSGFLVGQRPNSEIDKSAVKKAANTLQILWDKQYASEVPNTDSTLPYNLTQAYRALGEMDLAKKVTVQAIEKIPKDRDIIKLRSIFYLYDQNFHEALELLKTTKSDPEFTLLRAEVLSKNDPSAALQVLDNFEELTGVEDHQILMAVNLRFECIIASEVFTRDEKINLMRDEYRGIISKFPENPLALLVKAEFFQFIGDNGGSKETLENAKSKLKGDSDFTDRLILARKFEDLENYHDAADILDGYVDSSKDSPALRTLLRSLINCDRRTRAHDLLKSIPTVVSETEFFLRAAIFLHLRRGDYSAVDDAIDKLLRIKPKDLRAHLKRVDIWIRHRNDEAIKKFLDTNVEDLEGTPESRMQLAHLLCRFGFTERALSLGYKLQLENRNIEKIQMAYIGLLLTPASSNIDLHRDSVEQDIAFSIKNSSNLVDTLIIESDEKLRLVDEAISSTHPFAIAAMGLKEGDKFVVKEDEWEIISVKHKFLFSLHSKITRFDRYFPDSVGLKRFRVHKTGDGETSLDSMQKIIKKRHDAIEQSIDNYVKHTFPLELFAKRLGTDVIEVWHRLTQTGRNFRNCIGNVYEREEAFRFINENNRAGCVVDSLTLYIIRMLGVQDAIVECCGPISAPESTIDTFRFHRERILSHQNEPYKNMFYKDGQFFCEEVSEEDLKQLLNNVDIELDWIEREIEILPAEGKQDLSSENERLMDLISYTFFDPILSAQGHNRMLLCEDIAYRQIAKDEFNVATTWLQPVLMTALDLGLISKGKYCESIYSLVQARHSFISIDSRILSYALGKGEAPFKAVAKILFGIDSEIPSHFKVMIEFFRKIWRFNLTSLAEKKATGILLERLFFGEWKKNSPRLSAYDFATYFYYFLPYDSFREYLLGWLKGHFLISHEAS